MTAITVLRLGVDLPAALVPPPPGRPADDDAFARLLTAPPQPGMPNAPRPVPQPLRQDRIATLPADGTADSAPVTLEPAGPAAAKPVQAEPIAMPVAADRSDPQPAAPGWPNGAVHRNTFPIRSFEFTELGMFGRFGAQDWASLTVGSAARAPNDARAQPAAVAMPSGSPSASVLSPNAATTSAGTVDDLPAPVVVSSMSVPEMPDPTPVAPAIAAMPSEGRQVTEPSEIQTLARAAPLQRWMPPTTAPRNTQLTLAIDGNTVSIVARGDTDLDLVALRRQLESTVAEFGLNLGDLRLNGAAVESPSSPGAPYGHRTR